MSALLLVSLFSLTEPLAGEIHPNLVNSTSIVISTQYLTSTGIVSMTFEQVPSTFAAHQGTFILPKAEVVNTGMMVYRGTTETCYGYASFAFKAYKGQIVRATLSSSNVVNFYVMSMPQFSKLKMSCLNEEVDSTVRVEDVTAYSLDWAVPVDGTYYFLFINKLREELIVNLTADYVSTITSTLMSTSTSLWISPGQHDASDTTATSQPSQNQAFLGGSIAYQSGLLVLIFVAGVWGVRLWRKSRTRIARGITPTAPRSSDYRNYLRRLEELKDSGEITAATYRLLKSEYENKSQSGE